MIINWWSSTDKVRVCDACFEKKIIPEPKPPQTPPHLQQQHQHQLQNHHLSYQTTNPTMNTSNSNSSISSSTNNFAILNINANNDMIARKVTETVQETIGLISYATKLPFDVLKESARPSYWKPDSECINCALCKKPFDDIILLHHCRACGNGVCHTCSPHLR